MGLVLWIDQNTFATGLIEKVFKKKELPFYTLDSVKDFAYLVEDLSPALIVLDNETFAKDPEAFISQYRASGKMRAIPFIFLGSDEGLGFIENKIGELKRPLEPFGLPEVLSKMLEAN